jgi:kinesin family protein 18/19
MRKCTDDSQAQEVMQMLMQGNEARTISPTEANATSSRSHAVLQVNVSQKDRNAAVNEPHTMATLSIIDLAGSERASATKNRGDRLLEGANINKSLLALGSCINALCDPRQRNHVPYRNSKLTRLLKFSLGGNCRTVMIVCVSPSSAHFDETQNTLRYANRAKNIQTKVTRNVYNVNRHVKDFLKKIDEQMTLINELKEQQKDSENVAFAKFRKQNEKREVLVKEGIARIRSAYDHSGAERQERSSSMSKLRQIERRIHVINSWLAALETAYENRDDDDPPPSISAMRKTANGILVELESSRHHYHQRIAKNAWQRAIDSALQTGLKQLNEVGNASSSGEVDALIREAELLKTGAELEIFRTIADEEKIGDAALIQVQLRAHFETVAILNQLMSLPEDEAVQAAKNVIKSLIANSSTATFQVIKADKSLPIVEAFPPTKGGTPKRKKQRISLLGPPPKMMDVAPPSSAATAPGLLSSSPIKASPRRPRIVTPKKGRSLSPKKRSPKKRTVGVTWADDTAEGKLEEFSKTPQQIDSTPEPSFIDQAQKTAIDSSPDFLSPIHHIEPLPSSDLRPAPGRFQAGFLSRKSETNTSLSPAPPTLSFLTSSPEPSPLQEMTGNTAAGRRTNDPVPRPEQGEFGANENNSASDSEKPWMADEGEARQVGMAVKRASLARSASTRETSSRTIRRRSPGSSDTGGDIGAMLPPARRIRESSILSPTVASITKAMGATALRRTTVGDGSSLQRAAVRSTSSGRPSITPGSAQRPSMAGAGYKGWRA